MGAEPAYVLQKLLYLTIAFSVLFTIVATPVFIWRFRRRVTESMNAAASGADGERSTAGAESMPVVPAGAARPPLIAPATARLASPDGGVDNLLAIAGRRLRRLALAYAAGGVVHALITTAFFMIWAGESGSAAVLFPVFLVFLLPVAPTVSYVVAARPGGRMVWMAVAVVAAMLVVGPARDLVVTLLQTYLMLPALVFIVFNLRYWRAAASLVIPIAAAGALFWVAGAHLGSQIGGSSALWVLRLAGLAVGVAIGYLLVRGIAALHAANATSDQEIFLDVWWGIYSLTLAGILSVSDLRLLLSFVAFPAYWLVKRRLLRRVAAVGLDRPRGLLLLRVFGHGGRTERLLDLLTVRWRFLGPVHLIAGLDLVARGIDPDEFYAFLHGQLRRQFVKREDDLRLRPGDGPPGPDGRFDINQIYCHKDTWKMALEHLITRSEGVLMDLRGFDQRRVGCWHELGRLAAHVGHKPIVLLTDGETNLPAANWRLLGDGAPAVLPGAPRGTALTSFLDARSVSSRTIDVAIRLLLGARLAG